MTGGRPIDDELNDWPFEPGTVAARMVSAGGGREVLQMRIDMGIVQMEIEGRPDGARPGGQETTLDHLIQESLTAGDEFQLSEEQCAEIDREFVQYYQRRICWLSIQEFERAIRDADHTIALMDFALEHSNDEDWLVSHEQYRPFVIFHRTQAAALAGLEASGPEVAIEEIGRGLGRIRDVFANVDGQDDFDDDEMVGQLLRLQDWVREHYSVGRTLSEQLADAIAAEKFELAAELRDRIAERGGRM